MSIKYKFYAKVQKTFINLKGCSIVQSALPKKEEIIKAISEKRIPIQVIVEDDFFNKIRKEVQQKSSNKLFFDSLYISFIDPNYKPVVQIVSKKIATFRKQR